ncbi:MAG: hypothetical protein QM523_00585 [Candidatus Pacebacteria bacterium]|nr:hypothetical protein [Candidatus Paceibacterota bacterium]
MAELVIQNEEQLFAAIRQLQNGHLSFEGLSIKFDGWPNYRVTLRGDQYNGGLPIRKMMPLLKVQSAIDKYYSEQKYGVEKQLTLADKQKTSVIVHFESGSTVAVSRVFDTLNQIAPELITKMNGMQAVLTILGLAALYGCGWSIKTYLNYKAKIQEQELKAKGIEQELLLKIELSKQETERAKIIAEAASNNPLLQKQIDNMNSINDKLLKALQPGEQLVQDGQVLIDGTTAKELTRSSTKAEPTESRLDGRFLTITVDSGSVRDGFRMTIRNVETNEEIIVKVPAGTLSEEQIKTLQDGEWGKRPLNMQINVRKSGNRIISATLIEAGLS